MMSEHLKTPFMGALLHLYRYIKLGSDKNIPINIMVSIEKNKTKQWYPKEIL